MTEEEPGGTMQGAPSGGLVLVADASPEGGAIAAALRARGFSAENVPLSLLEARVMADAPNLVIVGVDQPEAVEIARQACRAAGAAGPELICLGDPGRARELGAGDRGRRAFDRPVDLDALVAEVSLHVEPSRAASPARGGTPPPSLLREREAPLPRPSDFPAELPHGDDQLEDAALFEAGEGALLGQVALSPELEQLLGEAESRLVEAREASPSRGAEDEVNLVLPPELLEGLDEPIDIAGDEARTGSALSQGQTTPAPRPAPTPAAAPEPARAPPTPAGAQATGDAKGDARGESPRPILPEAPPSAAPPARPAPSIPAPSIPAPAPPVAYAGAPLPSVPPGSPFVGQSPAADTLPPPLPRAASVLPAAPGPASTPPSRTTLEPSPFSAAQVPPSFPPSPSAGPPSRPTETGAQVRTSVLAEGDAVRALAQAVASRASGSLALREGAEPRRILLHEGDIVTACPATADETLLAFLAARGDLDRDLASRLAGRLPPFGRHAGAALVAHGYLGQDDLWPVLRAHAEWVIGRALSAPSGTSELEAEPPPRLRAEPNVFGGATGAEVLVETVRRVVTPEAAIEQLGGARSRLDLGPRAALLPECALGADEEELVRGLGGRTAEEALAGREPDLASVLFALVALGVLEALSPARPEPALRPENDDPLDDEALRKRVEARLALVHDADYFALLGVPRAATSYEIRRAYLALRRGLEPSRVLSARTADLAPDLRLLLEVIDEAYEILREPHRRERYRRAIEAEPG